MAWDDTAVREHVSRVEASLSRFEADPNGTTGAEAVEELVVLYGQCLERIMGHAERLGGEIQQTLADDELIGHLLLVHDLHPIELASRVQSGIEEVRELLGLDEDALTVIGIAGSTVRVGLRSSGCSSSFARTRGVVEEGIAKHAPEVDVVTEAESTKDQPLIPVDSLFAGGRVPDMG